MSIQRGTAWRREETIDLLSLFGQEAVQRSLLDCRRNREVFENIAREMSAKGHSRTWQECRNRTKALRHLYKKAQQHNNTSGNAPYRCPFYAELHAIYANNRAINPLRVNNSFSINVQQPEVRTPTESDLVTLHLTTLEEGDTGAEQLSQDLYSQVTESEQEVEESTQNTLQDAAENLLSPSTQGDTSYNGDGEESEDTADQSDHVDPRATLGEMSTEARNAADNMRRRRASAMERVGGRYLEQADRHNREDIEQRVLDRNNFREMMREYLDADRNMTLELTRTRELLGDVLTRNQQTFEVLAAAIVSSLNNRDPRPGATVAPEEDNSSANTPVIRKRALRQEPRKKKPFSPTN